SSRHTCVLRLGALRAVLRATLLAALHTNGVERATHDVIANARKILHAAPANQHERVLLQVVADAGNVRRDLDAVGQPDAGDLAKRGVRLLRRLREHTHAHTALLRTHLERRALGLGHDLLAPLSNELTD